MQPHFYFLLQLVALVGGKGSTTDNIARQENTKLQAQVKNLELKAEKAQKQLEQAVSSNNKNAKELETLKQEAANAKKDAEKSEREKNTASYLTLQETVDYLNMKHLKLQGSILI